MIGRRSIIATAAAALAAPLIAQPRQVSVAMLSVASFSTDVFRRYGLPELAAAGWREGDNLRFMAFTVQDDGGDLQQLARRIAVARPDVVIAVSNPAAMAIREAAPDLPIVMGFAGNDPTTDGLAQSLARPGGMVTGVVMLADELNLKRIGLAHDCFPERPIGYLVNRHLAAVAAERVRRIEARAGALGLRVVVGGQSEEVPTPEVFEVFRQAEVASIVVASSPTLAGAARDIAMAALAARLPTITEWRAMVLDGCAMSYGPNSAELRRRAARFIVRILRGERPAEMPMEQPERFELIVNQKILQAMGTSLPLHMLARADEVIE